MGMERHLKVQIINIFLRVMLEKGKRVRSQLIQRESKKYDKQWECPPGTNVAPLCLTKGLE